MRGPKSLAERLEWMAENLPGFREELDTVEAIKHRSRKASSAKQLKSSNYVDPYRGGRRVPRGRGVSDTVNGEQVPVALGDAEGEAVAPAPVGVPHRGRAYPAEGLRVHPIPPELQVKTIALTYPEFCLLLGVVADRANANQDSTGEWRRLYVRLGGSL
jgi:hypothetical protein